MLHIHYNYISHEIKGLCISAQLTFPTFLPQAPGKTKPAPNSRELDWQHQIGSGADRCRPGTQR